MTPREAFHTMSYEMQAAFNKAFWDNDKIGDFIMMIPTILVSAFLIFCAIAAFFDAYEKIDKLIFRFKTRNEPPPVPEEVNKNYRDYFID